MLCVFLTEKTAMCCSFGSEPEGKIISSSVLSGYIIERYFFVNGCEGPALGLKGC